ncbi:hypothetical protein [Streptomyces milbemycinicus]|uniref:hypothetical protein n=1 Tax=Streptomyces milbemycinicus TaxID=476552 RepID=UPI00340C8619
MPPLQRTVAEPELVTDPNGFRGSLDTWRDSSFLTPLGHLVSPEAPSGLGHGLATPGVPQAPDVGSTVGAPDTPTVSRGFDLPRSGGGGGDARPSGTPAVALQRVADSDVVEPLISARPPAMRIRQLPALPVAPAQRAVPGTDPTPPAVQRRSAAPTPPRPHAFGLGEPLAGLPPTAQRTPAASTGAVPMDDPGGGAAEAEQTEVSRPLLGDDPLEVLTADRADRADSGPVPPTPPAPMPAAPQPQPQASAERSPTPTPSVADRPPVPIQRASADGTPVAKAPSAPAAGPVVPLVAQRSVPLFSGVRPPSADDRTDGPADGPSGVSRSPAAEPPVVPVRWSEPAPSAQRSIASAAAPPPPPLSPSPSVSRSVPGGTPSPAGPRLVDAGAVAIAAGVAQRMADGSVVFRPPSPGPPSPRPSAPPSPTPPPSVAAAATPTVFSLPPPVQRDSGNTEPPPPEPEPEPEPEPTPRPPEESQAAAPPPPTTSEGKGGPPKVDDELVRALYAPLSRLLKAELRLERERAGFLINTRH